MLCRVDFLRVFQDKLRNSEQGGPGAVGAEYKNVSQGLQTGIEIETETSPIAASAVADKSGLLGLDRG